MSAALWLLIGLALGLTLAAALLPRRRRTHALRQELDSLEAVLEGMAQGVWLTDAGGIVLRHNRALRELFPPGQALMGERPLALLHSEPLQAAVDAACTQGQTTEVELAVEARILSVHVAPVGQKVPGPSMASFRDISELRRLERVRQEFVANVSHELRTPVTAILGYAETLLDGALANPAHAPGMVEIIHRQSQRLSRLVADLLELSRLDGQEVELQHTAIPLLAVARRAAEGVAPRAQQKAIHFEMSVPDALFTLGDERALEQVLVNLLDNAVKYTPEGGRISLGAAADGERVRLSVRDSGVGIPPQHLPRLFERFYRVDPGRSRELGGTGLGLAIVKHLISAMEGEIQVESRPGEGSEFTLLLRAAPPKATPAG